MRGFCKNMYYVRDTGSPVFSEAYFVLRRGGDVPVAENDLAAEADRIVRERFSGSPRRRLFRKFRGRILFVCGVLAGAGTAAIIQLLFR